MTAADALFRCGFPYVKTLGMRRVTSAAVDVVPGSDGRVYVLVRAEIPIGGCCIRILNLEDEDLGTIGETGSDDGQFSWPTKLLIDQDENLIVLDEALNRITVMGKDGSFLYNVGGSSTPISIRLTLDDTCELYIVFSTLRYNSFL